MNKTNRSSQIINYTKIDKILAYVAGYLLLL